MEDWFTVKKEDVIDELDKRKDCLPWGEHSDEKYRCLVFGKPVPDKFQFVEMIQNLANTLSRGK